MAVAPYAIGMGAGTPEAPWVQIRPGVYAPPGSAPAPVSAAKTVSAYSPLPNVGIAGPLPSSAPSLASVPVPVQPAPVYVPPSITTPYQPPASLPIALTGAAPGGINWGTPSTFQEIVNSGGAGLSPEHLAYAQQMVNAGQGGGNLFGLPAGQPAPPPPEAFAVGGAYGPGGSNFSQIAPEYRTQIINYWNKTGLYTQPITEASLGLTPALLQMAPYLTFSEGSISMTSDQMQQALGKMGERNFQSYAKDIGFDNSDKLVAFAVAQRELTKSGALTDDGLNTALAVRELGVENATKYLTAMQPDKADDVKKTVETIDKYKDYINKDGSLDIDKLIKVNITGVGAGFGILGTTMVGTHVPERPDPNRGKAELQQVATDLAAIGYGGEGDVSQRTNNLSQTLEGERGRVVTLQPYAEKDTAGNITGYNIAQYLLDKKYESQEAHTEAVQNLGTWFKDKKAVSSAILTGEMAFNEGNKSVAEPVVIAEKTWKGLGTSGMQDIMRTPAILEISPEEYKQKGASLQQHFAPVDQPGWQTPGQWGAAVAYGAGEAKHQVYEKTEKWPSFIKWPSRLVAGGSVAGAQGVLYTGVMSGKATQATLYEKKPLEGLRYFGTAAAVGVLTGAGAGRFNAPLGIIAATMAAPGAATGMYHFGVQAYQGMAKGDPWSTGEFITIVQPGLEKAPKVAKGVYMRAMVGKGVAGHYPFETLGFDVDVQRIDLPEGMSPAVGRQLIADVELLMLKGEKIDPKEIPSLQGVEGIKNVSVTRLPNGAADIKLYSDVGDIVGYATGMTRVSATQVMHATNEPIVPQTRAMAWDAVYGKASADVKAIMDTVGKNEFIEKGYDPFKKLVKATPEAQALMDELAANQKFVVKDLGEGAHHGKFDTPQADPLFVTRHIKERLAAGEKIEPQFVVTKLGAGELRDVPLDIREAVKDLPPKEAVTRMRDLMEERAASGDIEPGMYALYKGFWVNRPKLVSTMGGLGKTWKEAPVYNFELETFSTPGYKATFVDPTYIKGAKGFVESPVGVDMIAGRPTVIVRNSKGEIMLVDMSEKGNQPHLPGGSGQKVSEFLGRTPETPAEAASRELAEEVGIKIPPGKLKYKGTMLGSFTKGGAQERFYIYEAVTDQKPVPKAEIKHVSWWDGKAKVKGLADFVPDAIEGAKKGTLDLGEEKLKTYRMPIGKQIPIYYMLSDMAKEQGLQAFPTVKEQIAAKAAGDISAGRMAMPWHRAPRGKAGAEAEIYTTKAYKTVAVEMKTGKTKTMLTSADKLNLKKLGYTNKDIKGMMTEDAQNILDKQIIKGETQPVTEKPKPEEIKAEEEGLIGYKAPGLFGEATLAMSLAQRVQAVEEGLKPKEAVSGLDRIVPSEAPPYGRLPGEGISFEVPPKEKMPDERLPEEKLPIEKPPKEEIPPEEISPTEEAPPYEEVPPYKPPAYETPPYKPPYEEAPPYQPPYAPPYKPPYQPPYQPPYSRTGVPPTTPTVIVTKKKVQKGTPKSKVAYGTWIWRHGAYWEVLEPPYDKVVHMKNPPDGAYLFATGKGSAKKTLQIIPKGARPPRGETRADVGWAEAVITVDSTQPGGGTVKFIGHSKGRPHKGQTKAERIARGEIVEEPKKRGRPKKIAEETVPLESISEFTADRVDRTQVTEGELVNVKPKRNPMSWEALSEHLPTRAGTPTMKEATLSDIEASIPAVRHFTPRSRKKSYAAEQEPYVRYYLRRPLLAPDLSGALK